MQPGKSVNSGHGNGVGGGEISVRPRGGKAESWAQRNVDGAIAERALRTSQPSLCAGPATGQVQRAHSLSLSLSLLWRVAILYFSHVLVLQTPYRAYECTRQPKCSRLARRSEAITASTSCNPIIKSRSALKGLGTEVARHIKTMYSMVVLKVYSIR